MKKPKPRGEQWPLYWNLWKASHGPTSSIKDFRLLWTASKESGDWSIFQKLAVEFAAMSEAECRRRLGKKYRLFEATYFFCRSDEPAEEREQRNGRHHTTNSKSPHGDFDVLGIRPGATREEIRSAYRALALKHHPDHGGSVERMREINLAYATIVRNEGNAHV